MIMQECYSVPVGCNKKGMLVYHRAEITGAEFKMLMPLIEMLEKTYNSSDLSKISKRLIIIYNICPQVFQAFPWAIDHIKDSSIQEKLREKNRVLAEQSAIDSATR